MLRTTIMPVLTLLVGLAVIVRTIDAGRLVGVLLGVLLVAAGALRLWVERKAARHG